MSIYGGKELANAFRTVRKNTIQVAQDIPEDKYSFVSAPEVQSVARMLTHVAISTRIWEEMHKKRLTTLVGYDLFGMVITPWPEKRRLLAARMRRHPLRYAANARSGRVRV